MSTLFGTAVLPAGRRALAVLCVLLGCLGAGPAAAQSGVLQGAVFQSGTGLRVPGARVEIFAGAGAQPAVQFTDGNGAFRFTGLPTGSYSIEVTRAGFTPGRRRGVTVRDGRTTTANVVLRVRGSELASLSGRIQDPDGRGVRRAVVTLFTGASRGRSALSSTTGFYRLAGIIPDTYDVEVLAEGFERRVLTGVLLPAGARAVLDITLQPLGPASAAVSGFVFDLAGRAVAGARVEVTSGPVVGRATTTDESGAYRLRALPAGSYTLRASAIGFQPDFREVSLAEEEEERVDFALRRDTAQGGGAIFGVVSDTSGDPLAGVLVRLTAGPVTGGRVFTDGQGRFALTDLPRGTYTVSSSLNGFQPRTIAGVRISGSSDTRLDVQLRPSTGTGVILGAVRDDSGPLSDVLVEVFFLNTPAGSDETDDAGRFAVTGLEPGTYRVRFSRSGFRTVTLTGVVVEAGEDTRLDVRLVGSDEETGSIGGLIADPAGRAIPDVLVELTGPSGPRSTLTDANGTYLFVDLPPGEGYDLRASAPGLVPEEAFGINVRAGVRSEVNFILRGEAGTGSISGNVRNLSGFGIRDAVVILASGPVAGRQQFTGADGRFNFPGLPTGRYVIEVRALGYRTVQRTLTVQSGASTFVTVFLSR